MTSALEERLGAALTARAEQVQERDLRPEPAPEALLAPVVPLRRRRATYLLASAAAAAAIAVPFVLGGTGEEAPDVPTVEPTAVVTPPPDIGADWPVIPSYTTRADLDGDGTPEPVRVRVDGDEFTADRLRLEADLSSTGASVFGVVDLGGNAGYNIVDTIDADSDGGDELVLYVDSPDADPLGDVVDLRVLDLVDDFLVEVERRGDPPIRSGIILPGETEDGPQQGFAASYRIQNDTLYSAYAVNSYPFTNLTFSAPEVYEAEVWAYRIDNGFLVPQPQERVCVNRLETNRAGEERWSACGTDSGADVPGIFPAATDVVTIEQLLPTTLQDDSATVRFQGAVEGGEVGEGDLTLVVDSVFLGELRYSVPAGPAPAVFTRPVQPGPGGDLALLLQQESGDTTTMRVLAFSPDGELVEASPVGEVPFGNGLAEDGTPYQTWLNDDGTLYTAVGSRAADDERTVYTWDIDGPRRGDGLRLRPVELGTYCIDEDAPANTGVTRC